MCVRAVWWAGDTAFSLNCFLYRQTGVDSRRVKCYSWCVTKPVAQNISSKLSCFGTGMIVADLKHIETMACSRELLNRSVNNAVSSPAQCFFRTQPGTPSGPVALLWLMWFIARLTSRGLNTSTLDGGSLLCPCCGAWGIYKVKPGKDLTKLLREGWTHCVLCWAGVARIIRDGLDALPHALRVSVVKVLLNTLLVAALHFLYTSPPFGPGCSIGLLSPDQKAASQTLNRLITALFIHGLWLGSVWIFLSVVTLSIQKLMQSSTDEA